MILAVEKIYFDKYNNSSLSQEFVMDMSPASLVVIVTVGWYHVSD